MSGAAIVGERAVLLTRDEVDALQSAASFLASACSTFNPETIDRYLAQTALQVDGTLDPVLVHSFSITDLRRAQRNMRFVRDILQKALEIQALTAAQVVAEQGDA